MIITILGSSKFSKEMVAYKNQLEKLGHKVNLHDHYIAQGNGKMLDLVDRMNKEHSTVKKQYNYFRYHYDEILNSEAVLVLNLDKNGIKNYIGGNTLIEIAQAYINNKQIFLLNPVPEMSYTEEIKTMDPIVIKGDLSLIK